MSAADLRSDERKAIDADIARATARERERCAGIARFAARFCTTDIGSGVARSIAEAIENPVLDAVQQDAGAKE